MNEIIKKRAVIYCRVSTKEQVQEGNSLNTQEKICREYCLKNGYEVVEVFVEQGESAKTADRTELKKLLSFCATKGNHIQAIIIYKIDRLSRNTDDYSQLRLMLKHYGVEIRSTSEHFENTPVGRFMENTMANIAQFDNDIRTERSVGGMREAVREGRYVWNAPLGYNNVKINGRSTIAPDPILFPLIQQTFELIASNKYPTAEVRKIMETRGLLNKSGKPFCTSFFYRVIQRQIYTGWINKFGERHKGAFEPAISEALFEQVQRVLKRKGKNGVIHITDNPDFPLRRFVRNEFGKKLTGSWSQGRKKKYPFYRFQGEKSNYSRDKFERAFMEFMDKFKFSEEYVERLDSLLGKRLERLLSEKIKEKEQLKKRVEQLKAKQTLLLDKNFDGIISDHVLKQQMDIIEEELENASVLLLNFSENDSTHVELSAFVKEYLKNPSKIWRKAGVVTKIKLQWFQFPSGIIYENNLLRTAETVKVFKLKSHFSGRYSPNVRLGYKLSNNIEPPNPSIVPEIALEIKTLSKILEEDSARINTPG